MSFIRYWSLEGAVSFQNIGQMLLRRPFPLDIDVNGRCNLGIDQDSLVLTQDLLTNVLTLDVGLSAHDLGLETRLQASCDLI